MVYMSARVLNKYIRFPGDSVTQFTIKLHRLVGYIDLRSNVFRHQATQGNDDDDDDDYDEIAYFSLR